VATLPESAVKANTDEMSVPDAAHGDSGTGRAETLEVRSWQEAVASFQFPARVVTLDLTG
jgi:hypothetical protein